MFGLTSVEVAVLLAVLPVWSSPVPGFHTPHHTKVDKSTTNTLPLTRHSGISIGGPFRSRQRVKEIGSEPFTSHTGSNGLVFTAPMLFNSQTIQMVIDTGSSDTWVVVTNFTCQDPSTKKVIAENQCLFASTYNYNTSNTFIKIPNENFNITYQDGEFLSGIWGTENVTLAGINVKQQIAVANKAAWYGDGFTSGLVGLAYPSITSAYAGTDPTKDNLTSPTKYNPVFTTMWKSNITNPLFSIALNRSTKPNAGGVSAIGGLPTGVAYNTASLAHAPLLKTCDVTAGCNGTADNQYYAINVDNVQFGQADPKKTTTPNITAPFLQSSSFQAVVDSGTSEIRVPTFYANAFNALFDPPAVYDDNIGEYVTNCNATVPALNVQIGGKKFTVDTRDLLNPGYGGTSKGQCVTGFNDGGDGPYLLGDVFMKNVLSVFDIGMNEMRFYTTNVE